MTSIHSQVLERPSSPRTTSRPRRRVLVLALAVSVVAGGLAGWFLHRPGETTKTVAPPAYSAASTTTGTVYFDGVHASFAGPAEVSAGTVLVLRLTSTAPDASLVVSRLSPAPTWSVLTHDIATANTSPAVMPMPYVHPVATVGVSAATSVRLTRPGLYSLWAGPLTEPSAASVALATVLRVTG